MENVSFDEALKMIPEIYRIVSDLKEKEIGMVPEADRLMSLQEFQEYEFRRTGKRPAKQTVYDRTSKRKLPYERHGKNIYFRKSEIDRYWDNGKQII